MNPDCRTDRIRAESYHNLFKEELREVDPDVDMILRLEDERQARKVILIASESMCPPAISRALSSRFVNVYAEGYPSYHMLQKIGVEKPEFHEELAYLRRYSDRRYYKGVEYADFIEALAQKRAASCFATEKVRSEDIFVNVQPLSGAAANNAVYGAFLKPGDVVMGMDLAHGGHLTHGSPSNRSGKNYCIISYHANIETGEINFEELEENAARFRPKLIIAGYSAYPRKIDWKRFREIADSAGALLLADIAHPAGLVVAGCFPNPIDYADIVSFTTHKTLCGPRGAVLLTKDAEKAKLIDNAVFPGEQGGPHLNTIAAKAILFRLARTSEFEALQKNVLENSRHLASCFQKLGFRLAYGGTESHMCLVDLRNIKGISGFPLTGEVASRILDLCGITCNKNTIPGDTNPVHPGALRFGTTWITQRGFGKKEVETLAELIHRTVTAMKPFRYIEAQGDVGRAKIPIAVLVETKALVEKLIASLTVEERSCPDGFYPHYYSAADVTSVMSSPLEKIHREAGAKVEAINGHLTPLYYRDPDEGQDCAGRTLLIDSSDSGLLEVRGDRSRHFLEEVISGNALALSPGMSLHTFLLYDDGRIIDDVTIMMPHSRNHFLIKTNARHTAKVREYLRALSDGYVLFDQADLYKKISGPVVIEDLRICEDASRRMIILGIYGEDAALLLKNLGCAMCSGDRQVVKTRVGECGVTIAKVVIRGKDVGYDILVHPDEAGMVWNHILQSGKGEGVAPAGVTSRENIRRIHGLPEYRGDEQSCEDILSMYRSGFEGSIKLEKPYFTGQGALLSQLAPPARVSLFDFHEIEAPPAPTCLYEEHRKLSKKLVPFAGYTMPVWYGGINEEHRAVREAAGIFDVSHMGVLEIAGRDATRFLDLVSTNYATRLDPGQSQYTYLLDTQGNVLDDIMVYRREEDRYMVIVNAVNTNKVKAWLSGLIQNRFTIDADFPGKKLHLDVALRDLKEEKSGDERRVDLALQGARSREILLKAIESEDAVNRLMRLKRNEFFETHITGVSAIISRTGYTGEEYGYEMYIHPAKAPLIWNLILSKGRESGLIPAGLGARDSTRTQAGLPLYGHELAGAYNITPQEAGYGPFVKYHKAFFIGRRAIIEKEKNSDMTVVRFRVTAKGVRIVKPHDPLVTKRGDYIGNVTSSVPVEGIQYGMAYVRKRYAKENTKVGVFILPRDKRELAEKPKDKLAAGDRLLLPEEAEIISRFPLPEEPGVACRE